MSASFRDPAGKLLWVRGRLVRVVWASGAEDVAAFLGSARGRDLIGRGRVVPTSVMDADQVRELRATAGPLEASAVDRAVLVLEHERMWFPSYPYEWAPEMLHDAGSLTLDLADELLDEGLGLKDATPYNTLFRGPTPTFVDVLSFERRSPGDARWLPHAQFVRTFLLPLLLSRHFGVPLRQSLAARRDGVEPEAVYRLCGPLRRMLPPFLTLVSLPTWLAGARVRSDKALYRPQPGVDPEKARFILRGLLRHLRRQLRALAPASRGASAWASYCETNPHAAEHRTAKLEFVEAFMPKGEGRVALDVGCNTGYVSALLARRGMSVVAIDSDPVVVGETWRLARRDDLDILPLVVDIADPTPASGWRNEERMAFLERARGRFDLVVMLAIAHHLMLTDGAPLPWIVDLAADLTRDVAVIEFVGPQDPLFSRLARGRDYLYADLSVKAFQTACCARFSIEAVRRLEGAERWLFALRRKDRGAAPAA